MSKLKLFHLKDEILAMYDAGVSCPQIATSLGEYDQAVYNLVKKYRQISSPQGTANFRYFQTIDTHTKAYFLGFIAGDGALVKSTQSNCITLTITIHSKDRIVLEKLREELQMSRPLYELHDKNHVRLVLSNKLLAQDLMSYGLSFRKSLSMPNIIPNIPEEFRSSFILGYFDADGSCTVRVAKSMQRGRVYSSVKQAVQIRGTEDFLRGIVDHLKIRTYHINRSYNIANLAISSKEEFKSFYEKVYKDCPFFLERKHVKFLPITKQNQTISSPSVN